MTSLGENECTTSKYSQASQLMASTRKGGAPTDHLGLSGLTCHLLREVFRKKTIPNTSHNLCVFGKPLHSLYFEYLERFMSHEPYKGLGKFAVQFFNEGREGSMRRVSSMDSALAKFLTTMMVQKPNTLIVLTGDNGVGHGDYFDKTDEGRTENVLPPLFMVVPTALTHAQPSLRAALYANQYKLTSHTDIYATLRHLLQLPSTVPHPGAGGSDAPLFARPLRSPVLRDTGTLPHGRSLFVPLSRHRTCKNAGIPRHLCACVAWRTATMDLRGVAEFALSKMNEKIWRAHANAKLEMDVAAQSTCADLRMSSIVTGNEMVQQSG